MKRDVFNSFLDWKRKSGRKPLVLMGARQVGKTWLMRDFGKRNFARVHEFNFDGVVDLASVFVNTKKPDDLLRKLSIIGGVKINPAEDLVIFDEIQECPDALNSLKYFNEDRPELAIIAAGSLLGVKLGRRKSAVGGELPSSYPVGKVELLDIEPMTFGEYLRERDAALHEYWAEVSGCEPLDEIFHHRLLDAYDEYLIVGGMPGCVSGFLANGDVAEVRKIQRDLLALYEDDIVKHNGPIDAAKVLVVLRSLVPQLAKANGKFIYGVAKEGARAREYEGAIEWLVSARIVRRIHNVAKMTYPLSAQEIRNAFKLYHLDVGLMRELAEVQPKSIAMNEDFAFKGRLAENYVLQQLWGRSDGATRYWSEREEKEIDFAIQHEGEIVPVEVKAGEDKKASTFKNYVKEKCPKWAIRFSRRNLKRDGGFVNIPLYLVERFSACLMKSFVFLAVAAASFGMAVAAPQPKEDGAKADAVATGVVAQADALLGREPPPRKLDAIGKRLRSPIGENIATLADAYAATKDRKYLDGAVRYMRAAAAYSDWKPSYYLTCAGVMNGFSRALEVCGKDMDAEVRAELQDVLLDKGLKGSFLGWWWWAKSNWTQVCCYAVAYAALQIRDRHPRRAESYLKDAINGTKSAMEAYAPDGCYTEGPSYWHYATENTEKMIAVLRRCNGGDDGGISAMPGYEASKRWIADLRGPTGRIFGFADGSPVPDEPRAWGVTNVFVRVHRGIQPTGVLASPTMWVAVKGGRARVNHAHMDAGCFVLETVRGGRPVRWVEDLGTEKYSLMEKAGLDVWNTRQSSTRWRVFRQGVQAHAVLTVDGGDFDVGGNVTLAADGSDAIAADLTELCGEWKKATRRWRLTEGGLTLTDEIAGAKEGHSAVFNFLTRAKPEVEGRVLRLTCDGQTLEVTAGQDGAWTVEDVSRPRQKFDSPNPGVTRVAFTCPLRDGKLSFAFACGGVCP